MSEEINKTLAKMEIVEARLAHMEEVISSASHSVTTNNSDVVEEALNAYKLQLLDKLKAIKETLLKEDGDIQSIRNERDAALKENASLKKENERLNYRVRHLIKALNEEELKVKR